MKHFILALLVFLVWGGIGIFYLHNSGNFQEQAASTTTQELNPWQNQADFNIAEDPNFNTNPAIYPDNSILSNEMSGTVNSLKKQYGIEISNKSDTENIKNLKRVDLFPEFKYGQLVIDQNLINYGKILEKSVIGNPEMKITFIGHFNDEGTSLDNYFEGLQRAKHLKQYIVENFEITENNISAISEGQSRKIVDSDTNPQPTNNRIEILIED